jgi:nitrate/TMAO reductase-like tetraheme cytochrome c subunit
MVAPVIVVAGIAARYGAKKLMKHLTSKSARTVAKKQNKVMKEINNTPKPTGAAKVKANASRAKFMDKLNAAKPGPKNKQNYKDKGTYLDKRKSKRDINQLNKKTSKLKKTNTSRSSSKHNEVEHKINRNRDYVDNTRSNYSASARKTLPKSK